MLNDTQFSLIRNAQRHAWLRWSLAPVSRTCCAPEVDTNDDATEYPALWQSRGVFDEDAAEGMPTLLAGQLDARNERGAAGPMLLGRTPEPLPSPKPDLAGAASREGSKRACSRKKAPPVRAKDAVGRDHSLSDDSTAEGSTSSLSQEDEREPCRSFDDCETRGIEMWPDGAHYEGEFSGGRKHGMGIYTSPEGLRYEGQFVDDKMHGKGHYTFTDGRSYFGQFRHGAISGQGRMEFRDGSSYEGAYEDNHKHGQGTFTWPDGQKYVGQWSGGQPHGQGKRLARDGTTLGSGTWFKGHEVAFVPAAEG
mmetsp:Transcript_102897/g.291403  ORF Transcript_102897/g.291403 Transcript_102897/m.291403 type:complete len:308 (+) Transcript_102897:65-988(+)